MFFYCCGICIYMVNCYMKSYLHGELFYGVFLHDIWCEYVQAVLQYLLVPGMCMWLLYSSLVLFSGILEFLYSLGLYSSRPRVATAGHMGKGSPSASNGEKSFLGVSTIVSSSGKRGTCYGDLFRSLHAPSQSWIAHILNPWNVLMHWMIRNKLRCEFLAVWVYQ